MPELLLELLSEEIPARMQQQAAEDLWRLLGEALTLLNPTTRDQFYRPLHGPRRIAIIMNVADTSCDALKTERGPRVTAPEAAIEGFARKHGADRGALHEEDGYYVLRRIIKGWTAPNLIARVLPPLIRRFPWPKSMRWGQGSALTWVRPLRRILCLLDGVRVPFDLRDGEDHGHGLTSGTLSEGHRFMAPDPFTVTGAAQWMAELATRRVMLRVEDRIEATGQVTLPEGCAIVPDPELAAEVAGLVEWPVPLIGRIDAAYMDLPAEVMQVSMRVNQRYFASRDAEGRPAPYFAFAANIAAADGGAAIIAGNERVLRARFADARHFWDLDRSKPLGAYLPGLGQVQFHAKLGNLGQRSERVRRLVEKIAPMVGANEAYAVDAARYAKADLLTGMVGEFPELQGIMGGYYAAATFAPEVALAISEQYLPKGATDAVPTAPVSIALGLADRLDLLAGFFSINERPTGSGDPYALRRAALGILRFTWDNQNLRLPLRSLIEQAGAAFPEPPNTDGVLGFIIDRLRVLLLQEGKRHDVLTAIFAVGGMDDLGRLHQQVDAVSYMLTASNGVNLLAGYRRAVNILRIEQKRDGLSYAPPHDPALLCEPAEIGLANALAAANIAIGPAIANGYYATAMADMANLRAPIDTFFEQVLINDLDHSALRANRLRLLASLRDTLHLAADFSKIEG